MSVSRVNVSSVRFEINARPASASMQALQTEADSLNRQMDDVRRKIKDLGNVEFNNPTLKEYNAQLSDLDKKLKDVNKTMRDYTRGVKAADELLRAYESGRIEDLSMKAIKAGQNGLNKRIENIKPETASKEDAEAYRIITEVIREAQRVVDTFKTDAKETIRILEDGGVVAETTLKKTRDGVKSLMESTKEGTKENREYRQQFEFLTEKMKQLEAESGRISGQKLLGRVFRGDFAEADKKTLEEVIAKLREYQNVISDPEGKGQRIMAATEKQIRNLSDTLNTIKENGALRLMTERMQSLSNLSKDALTETKKFWQAMYDGAEKNDPELKNIEQRLKDINAEEQRRTTEQLHDKAWRVKSGAYSSLDENELRESINSAREYQKTLMVGGTLYNEYSVAIAKAEDHLKQYGVETERAKLKQEELDRVMREQLNLGTDLTEGALKAQENYWRRLIDDPKTAKESLDGYRVELEKVIDLQRQQSEATRNERAARLDNPANFSNLSETEIREAIEAGKQLIQTYETGDARARTLGENIVAAEQHLKNYGVEAARTAQREADAIEKANKAQQERINLMVEQFNRGGMSDSALKANERFWQQLIDDPKTAAESLQTYKDNLAAVQDEIERRKQETIETEGMSAFSFFENGEDANASASEVKKRADAMKAWRDSLPKQDEAETINRINEHLQRVGQTAKKAAEDVMSLDDALELAEKAGKNDFLTNNKEGFFASPQQLQAATKAINERRDAVIKLIQENKRLGLSTEKEEAELDELTRHLRSLKFEQDHLNMSQEKMRTLMAQPTSAVSLDELRTAIKRADGELRRMEGSLGQNSKEYQNFAKQVKEAKLRLKEMEDQSKATTSAFEKAWQRLKTYVTFYVSAAAAIQKITATFGDLMDLSDRMGEVRKTTGFTADEVGRLSDNLKKMDVRTSLVDLVSLSAAAGQLGLKSIEDVQGFTEAANKMMIALPEMGKEAATEMMRVALATGEVRKIEQQMQEGVEHGSSATALAVEKIASTVDRLRATSASTAPEITDFVKRVGSVGAQSGIAIDQVAALGSTISSLGLRIEMSATALSRMIPAIKNNAYSIGQIIGQTEKEIRDKFNTGRGMEVILDVFEAIRNSGKETADDIENMFGGTMGDIMKELNQQGARAGIVFAGLSQNVDELRRQLGVASSAYKENTAIQQEYERMNETTAAKWARLKNEIEEFWVGDNSQRGLGVMLDILRAIVNAFTGSGGLNIALRTVVTLLAAAKMNMAGIFASIGNIGTGLKGVLATLHIINKETGKLAWGNIFTAIGTAIFYVIYQLKTLRDEISETFTRLQMEEQAAERDINRLVGAVKKSSTAVAEATRRHEELTGRTEQLRREVDEMRQSTDKSTEAQDALKEKTKQLKKSEDDLKKSTDDLNKSKKDHSSVISEINSKYSTYLGYMLSEVTNADLVASAHRRIVAAMREELEQKRLLANQEAIEQKYEGNIQEWTQDSRDELKGLPRDVQDQIMRRRSNMMAQVSYEMQEQKDKNGQVTVVGRFVVPAIDGLTTQSKQFATEQEARAYLKRLTTRIVKQETIDKGVSLGKKTKTITVKGDYLGTVKRKTVTTGEDMTPEEFVNRAWGGAYGSLNPDDGFQRLTTAELLRMQDRERQRYQDQGAVEGANAQLNSQTLADIKANAQSISATLKGNQKLTDQQISEMGRQLNAVVQSSRKYSGSATNVQIYFGDGKEMTLDNAAQTMLANLDAETRKKVLRAARRNEQAGTGGTTVPKEVTREHPYGSYDQATSPYSEWNADDLVARRKDMLQRVRALANGADVQAVLSEDARFISGAVKKNIKTTRDAIEWYNTERLKIQDELYSRHLTNTGGWKDPKKGGGNWRRQLQTDFDSYLRILDAYYTERKARIEQAQTEEGMSEAEAQRLTIENETVWRKHRMELQQIYLGKGEEIAREERQRIYAILSEQDEDDPLFVEKSIEKSLQKMDQLAVKSEVDYNKIMSKLRKNIATDLYKQQNAVSKQMEAIAAIIAKERPFNGLTEDLEQNLSTMGILFADLDKKRQKAIANGLEPEDDSALRGSGARTKRMLLLLQEAENAYSTTFDHLAERMRQSGLGDWADELAGDEQKQQAVIAALHSFFDKVQDAIKREASQVKKQVEIAWNDAILPNGKSIKATYEQAISALGVEQGRVSRANSLINAGNASARVADRLAIRQMQVQLQMQEHYYNLVRRTAMERIADIRRREAAAREAGRTDEAEQLALDAKHATMSMNLSLAKEETELAKQREAIIERTEESQNRLYTSLREWADLLTSSLQQVFEAEHAGDAEYYNERAKLDLTGKGGPGAGTYVVIDNAGTSDASAHYEYLDERQALERQHEIEIENARAEAWRKFMDDFNQKLSDQITDWLNAAAQQAALEANTAELKNVEQELDKQAGTTEDNTGAQNVNAGALNANTGAVNALTQQLAQGIKINTGEDSPAYKAGGNGQSVNDGDMGVDEEGVPIALKAAEDPHIPKSWQHTGQPDNEAQSTLGLDGKPIPLLSDNQAWISVPMALPEAEEQNPFAKYAEWSGAATEEVLANQQRVKQGQTQTDKQITSSNQSAIAKMIQATNLYGAAYQAMSNDNLSAMQKFEMIALQAVGNAAMVGLQVALTEAFGKTAVNEAQALSKDNAENGSILGPILWAVGSALVGGLMGLAASKIAKSKAQISQMTGASASAGRLATGMLTYAEGNVNEFSDPASLTPGRTYNVDAADGRTYRAKYTGANPRTHITNGPEFHLVGERGREAIIDAHTTRLLQMDDTGIWQSIQTLYNGGSLAALRRSRNARRGRGMAAFADGNLDDFNDVMGSDMGDTGLGFDPTSLQASLDRNSDIQEALLERLRHPLTVAGTGPDGVVAMYDKLKKQAQRHGEKYI